MRMTELFSQTLREAPSETELFSQQLLIRAGYIRQLAAGIFTYLPLALKTLNKIENIMREEINAIGGQEILMPIVHPAILWQETGRWYQIGQEMGRFRDRNGRDMVLSMTHEEVVADLIRKEIRSYRQLPQLLYHIQTKWRDDPRPRAGLIRAREFTMKDSYSLDRDWEGLDRQYRAHFQAYSNIFNHCGLDVIAVKSDVGMMGGQTAHEFIYITPIGEDTIIICDNCGYSANRQIANFNKAPSSVEPVESMQTVATPGIKTIEELSAFLGISPSKTAKALFYIASTIENSETKDEFIFAVIRGDMTLNETKLANVLKASEMRPATEDEIKQTGAVPGYASPVGLNDVKIIVDDLIPRSTNLVAGANIEGYHTLNVNYNHDFMADIIADIVYAEEGYPCPRCNQDLKSVRGVEVGNIFKLGTRYSEKMGCNYIDSNGEIKPIVMGSYGIGSGRLLACIAEEYHDENGLVLPITIAPYQIHLIYLPSKPKGVDIPIDEGTSLEVALRFYKQLEDEGIEVLFDDRDSSPGIKFVDADLIGIPIRLTISDRSISRGGIEYKLRNSGEKIYIPPEDVVSYIKDSIMNLTADIHKIINLVPF
jgi:prolyl-tRNA synthetase